MILLALCNGHFIGRHHTSISLRIVIGQLIAQLQVIRQVILEFQEFNVVRFAGYLQQNVL